MRDVENKFATHLLMNIHNQPVGNPVPERISGDGSDKKEIMRREITAGSLGRLEISLFAMAASDDTDAAAPAFAGRLHRAPDSERAGTESVLAYDQGPIAQQSETLMKSATNTNRRPPCAPSYLNNPSARKRP